MTQDDIDLMQKHLMVAGCTLVSLAYELATQTKDLDTLNRASLHHRHQNLIPVLKISLNSLNPPLASLNLGYECQRTGKMMINILELKMERTSN